LHNRLLIIIILSFYIFLVPDNHSRTNADDALSDKELAHIINTLLKDFPADQLPVLRRSVSPLWVVNTLERIQTLDGTDPSKDFLQRLAAQLLSRYGDKDLGRLAPNAFICIVDEAGRMYEAAGKENGAMSKSADDVVIK